MGETRITSFEKWWQIDIKLLDIIAFYSNQNVLSLRSELNRKRLTALTVFWKIREGRKDLISIPEQSKKSQNNINFTTLFWRIGNWNCFLNHTQIIKILDHQQIVESFVVKQMPCIQIIRDAKLGSLLPLCIYNVCSKISVESRTHPLHVMSAVNQTLSPVNQQRWRQVQTRRIPCTLVSWEVPDQASRILPFFLSASLQPNSIRLLMMDS